MAVASITRQQLAERCGAGSVDLIDVRTPADYGEVHLPEARNVPLDRLDPAAVMASRSRSEHEPLYIICHAGSRGRQAGEKFLAAGFPNIINVDGGTVACIAAGLSVIRGREAISLERQVRIAARSLVVIGVLLGWLVHPGFFGLAAFVGVGLVFAGITDTCGMGMVLVRMPWNQGSEPPTTCSASPAQRAT